RSAAPCMLPMASSLSSSHSGTRELTGRTTPGTTDLTRFSNCPHIVGRWSSRRYDHQKSRGVGAVKARAIAARAEGDTDMTYRNILVHVDTGRSAAARIDLAFAVGARDDGFVIGVHPATPEFLPAYFEA